GGWGVACDQGCSGGAPHHQGRSGGQGQDHGAFFARACSCLAWAHRGGGFGLVLWALEVVCVHGGHSFERMNGTLTCRGWCCGWGCCTGCVGLRGVWAPILGVTQG